MTWKRWTWVVVLLLAGSATADEIAGEAIVVPEKSDVELAQEDRIAELERIVEVLADELETTRESITLPEEPELKALYGRGPGAARIYGLERGLHIGGYGETIYTNFFNEPEQADRWDNLRTVLYVGYRFSDRILFNSEIEFEHASTSATNSASGGSVSVEFANLDFLLTDWANTRIGMMLVPMGFLNQMHEPPFFYGALRPEPERRIIPSTWRENGGGLFGRFFGGAVEYEAYAITGLNAAGFDAGGLRGGRQKGNRALAEDFAGVLRLDWYATDDLLLGGSVYVGNSGQDQTLLIGGGPATTPIPDALTTLWELHAEWEKWGVHLRGLFTMAHVDDAAALTTALRLTGDIGVTETIAERMLGGYAEVAYDILPWFTGPTDSTLSPYYRYEYTDSQNRVPTGFAADPLETIWNHVVGIQYEPIPNVVIKTDVRLRDSDGGDVTDEFNLGVGFVF
jgi:hypothetical protein